jgi:hypothetical protein
MWYKTTIIHSQKNVIDLYLRPCGSCFEVVIYGTFNGQYICLIRDAIKGRKKSLAFDQYGGKINWLKTTKIPESASSFTIDLAKANKETGYRRPLDDLKYDIANAINLTVNNRVLTRYLKNEITGTWRSDDIMLTFFKTGKYTLDGTPPNRSCLHTTFKEGAWGISRNMLFFVNKKRNVGLRTQVVDIRDAMLVLPGHEGCLHYILKKQMSE